MTDFLSKIIKEFSNEDSKKSVKSSKAKRSINYFGYVNSKYEPLLKNYEFLCDDMTMDIKRKVVEECINRVSQITRKEYLAKLRDTMTVFLFNLNFLLECRNLGLNPFSVAQNIIILNRHNKVSRIGLQETFKGDFELLKEPLFSEAELADAKFSGAESNATDAQKTQLSTLIEGAMSVLPGAKTEPNEDVNVNNE